MTKQSNAAAQAQTRMVPTAGAAEGTNTTTFVSPLDATRTFEQRVAEFISHDPNGVRVCEPELLEQLRAVDSDLNRSMAHLSALPVDQQTALVEAMTQQRRERKQRELASSSIQPLVSPAQWADAMQRHSQNVLAHTPAESGLDQVRQGEQAPGAEPNSAPLGQVAPAAPAPAVRPRPPTLKLKFLQSISEDDMKDKKKVATAINRLTTNQQSNHKALVALGNFMENAVGGLTPIIQRAGHVDDALREHTRLLDGFGSHLQQMQEAVTTLSNNVSSLSTERALARGDELLQGDLMETEHNASAGGAAPGAADPTPSGSGGTAARYAEDPAITPAIQLRSGFQWLWQGDRWMVEQMPSTFCNVGNVRSYETRLGEWAAADTPQAALPTTTASKVRMPPPAPFNGEGSEVDPDLTVMGFETYFSSLGLERGEWGKQAQNLLRGKASQAYAAQAIPLYNSTGQHPTWDTVRKMILSFKKVDTPVVMRAKLATAQETDSVSGFTRHFNWLRQQVGSDPPAETDLITYYLKGLKNPTPLGPLGLAWTSLDEVQQYHDRKELASLQVQQTVKPRFPKPFGKTFPKPPHAQLKTAAVQRPHPSGQDQQSSGRGGGRGRTSLPGGRGPGRGGRGQGEYTKQPLDLSAFGAPNSTVFKMYTDQACPVHGPGHTKGDCRTYQALAKGHK
jgi:hypothetical protein